MSGAIGMLLEAAAIAAAAVAVVLSRCPPGEIRGSWNPQSWLRYEVIATLMGRDPRIGTGTEGAGASAPDGMGSAGAPLGGRALTWADPSDSDAGASERTGARPGERAASAAHARQPHAHRAGRKAV